MVQLLHLASASTETRCKLANQSASLDITLRSSADFPTRISTFGKYLHCTVTFVHTSAVVQIRSHTCYQPQYDNVYTTPVPYDMNTKKHGIGHTQHREGAFEFVYVRSFSNTLNHSAAILSDVRGWGTVVEEKLVVLNVSHSKLSPGMRT